ncbi:MAG: hypothetical protein RSA90_00160 [Lachnospiraceae bacterium]
MKIVDAVWEKRNLGVNTVEIEVEQNDTTPEVKRYLEELGTAYQVLKIPNSRFDMSQVAGDCQFHFVEGMMKLSNMLMDISRTSVQQRMYDAVSIQNMNHEDIDYLFNEIKAGMFDSDRISIDPYFGKRQAAERYAGWIEDEIERNTEFIKYVYKDETIGFFTLRESTQGVYVSVLGGIYKRFRKSGIGTVVKVPEAVKVRGGKQLEVYVSTNNIIQIKTLLINGYVPKSVHYVYVKHM